jgi:hypothetical protein
MWEACATARSAPTSQGDHGEIRLHPGSAVGHRDRVLIRRETEPGLRDMFTYPEPFDRT